MESAIFYNPRAGGGAAGKFFSRYSAELLDLFPESIVAESPGPEATGDLITGWLDKRLKYLIVIGGDGTLNDCLQRWRGPTTLIPIPSGNANDFSRRVGFIDPRETLSALRRWRANPAVKTFDRGWIARGGIRIRAFLNHVGVGVTARTVANVEAMTVKFYKLGGLFTLLGETPAPLKIRFAGRTFDGLALGVEFLLSPVVGRNIQFAPKKKENDGGLSQIIIKKMGFLNKLRFIAHLTAGDKLLQNPDLEIINRQTHQEPANTDFSRALIHLFGSHEGPAIPVHVDGNPLVGNFFTPGSNMEVEVEQGIITVPAIGGGA